MSALFDSSSVISAGPKAAVTAATVSGGVAFLAFDDGTLRCYDSVSGMSINMFHTSYLVNTSLLYYLNARADAGPSAAFEAGAVYPKFWKDLKKLCRSLLVVQEWNLLFSTTGKLSRRCAGALLLESVCGA